MSLSSATCVLQSDVVLGGVNVSMTRRVIVTLTRRVTCAIHDVIVVPSQTAHVTMALTATLVCQCHINLSSSLIQIQHSFNTIPFIQCISKPIDLVFCNHAAFTLLVFFFSCLFLAEAYRWGLTTSYSLYCATLLFSYQLLKALIHLIFCIMCSHLFVMCFIY